MALQDVDPTTHPIRRITPNPGGQLALQDIVGRNRSVNAAMQALLDDRRHLLVDEPRRFGKSSTVQLLVATIQNAEHEAIYHSVQGDNTLIKVITSILGALSAIPGGKSGWIKSTLKNYVKEVNLGPVGLSLGFENDPLAALRLSLKDIDAELGREKKLLVICLDELTETVDAIATNEGNAKALEFLTEFRRIRETMSNIRWVLTGSVGFHHVLRKIGTTDAIVNDTKQFELGPLSPDWATWLAGSVLHGANLPEEHQSSMSAFANRTWRET
jgi:hypothetical protein